MAHERYPVTISPRIVPLGTREALLERHAQPPLPERSDRVVELINPL
jgi:hypothetical protein